MKRAQLACYIEEQIVELKITRTAFAQKAGLSRSELYKILSQDVGQLKLSTLTGIARALNINPLNLIHGLIGEIVPSNGNGCCRPRYSGDEMGVVRTSALSECRMLRAGEEFTQSWELRNMGQIAWIKRKLICLDGNVVVLGGHNKFSLPILQTAIEAESQEIAIPDCMSGGAVKIEVNFKAPNHYCTTASYWKMADKDGMYCFPGLEELYCKIHIYES